MEMNGLKTKRWGFMKGNEEPRKASWITIRSVLNTLLDNLNPVDRRPVVPLGQGDPSAFPSFRTTPIAEDAISDAVRSAKFNCYSSTVGIPQSRNSIAEYLSKDLPNKLSPDDVYVTVGCTQAIEVILTALARPNANILFPRPGFPFYEARAAFGHLEVRHFDLLPDKGWEVDLDAVEDLVDENTVAMVVINPGNPWGNVYTYQHLKKVAARKLGMLVIADEVYDHLVFGSNPFVPMGVFGSIAPIITLGSISKRWIVPGWRLGWLVTNDSNGILKEYGIVNCIKEILNISPDPATFIQGALPQILGNTKEDFFSKIINTLSEAAEIGYDRIKEITCMTCPSKPEGSMFMMVRAEELTRIQSIFCDDVDFCVKLAKEESVIILPGIAVGLKNWLRVTFAIEPSSLGEGLGRVKAFCERNAIASQETIKI